MPLSGGEASSPVLGAWNFLRCRQDAQNAAFAGLLTSLIGAARAGSVRVATPEWDPKDPGAMAFIVDGISAGREPGRRTNVHLGSQIAWRVGTCAVLSNELSTSTSDGSQFMSESNRASRVTPSTDVPEYEPILWVLACHSCAMLN